MEVLIEFERRPLYFADPSEVITTYSLAEIPACFEKMEAALRRGNYLAGFLSYEAGYAFEPRLCSPKGFAFPLFSFGVYRQPRPPEAWRGRNESRLSRGEANIAAPDYFSAIEAIREYIAAGEVYQITYCLKYKFAFEGDDRALYRRLLKAQPVPYPAFIKGDNFSLLSLSPELFMKKDGEKIIAKPMKGTWPRQGRLDFWNGWRLRHDPKNRAENIMICDLLRNDLGRIGSRIRAPRLFEVARYRTLYQLTSTVTGRVEADLPLIELFAALHPSGSVTGAPKIRAMEIIRQLESEERRIYTGAIGYITPRKDLFFNVPIRTLLLQNGRGEMGVGGGIVWDSTPKGELEECRTKAKFLFS
jgi:para-aminobenzoate synthetase/4-amino-4-deoxychorismate lyase